MAGLVYSKDPAPPPVVVKTPAPVPPKPDSKSIKVPVLMSGDLGLDEEYEVQISDRQLGMPEVETIGVLEMSVAKQEAQQQKSIGFMGKVSGMMGFSKKETKIESV